MRAGKLNKKVTILYPVTVQSTVSGEQTITWATFLRNRWAGVEPLSMREQVLSAQIAAQQDTRITIRYATGITPDMRIVYDGSSYFIDSVLDPDYEHKEIQILCHKLST